MSKKGRLSGEEHQELFAKDADSGSNTENDKNEDALHHVKKFQSSMMLARFCVGSGLFSIPAAFRFSGIAVGVSWVFFNGFLTAYGMRKLVHVSWEVSGRTGASTVFYGDLGEECVKVFSEKWAKFGRSLVNGVIALTTFAMVCTQMIYMASLWKQGCEQLGVPEMDITSWIFVVYLILFPCFQIRRPDILAHCSFLANILTVVGTISVFVHIFSVSTFRTHVNILVSSSTNAIHWSKLPLTIGVTSYAYQLVAPLAVTIQNVMKTPRKLPFVINIVMAVVSVLYGFMGATGYASCYPGCEDSILLNLPGSRYYSIVKVLLALSSCIGTVIAVFVCFSVVEPILKTIFPENRFLCASITTRIFAVTLAAGITASVPQLGNIMSLAGTLTNPTFAFIFPAIAHLALFYKTVSRVSLAQDIALLVFGILILFIGIFSTIYQIAHDFAYFKHSNVT